MSKRPKKKQSDFNSKSEYQKWVKRSKAAKKGWLTRKAKVLPKKIRRAKQLVNNARAIAKKKPLKPVKQPRKKKNATEEKKRIRQLEKQLAELEEKFAETQWPSGVTSDFLRKDGTVALMPCRLRPLPDATYLEKELIDADMKGKNELMAKAQEIAMEFDCPLREVYTLFMSP